MQYTFKQLKEKYNWTCSDTLSISRQISYAGSKGVHIEKIGNSIPAQFVILNNPEECFTKNQIQKKYKWNEGNIVNFEKYAQDRGVILEKLTFCKKPYFYKIIEDNSRNDEEWVECSLLPEYEVTKSGFIRKKNNKKIITTKSSYGYIQLVVNGKSYLVHRLIMQTFNPVQNMEEKIVDHINGIRTDNRLENLRWATPLENMSFKKENRYEIQKNIQKAIQKFGYDEFNQILVNLINEN